MFAYVMKGWWDAHVYAGIHQGSQDYARVTHCPFATESLYPSNITEFYGWVWGISVTRILMFLFYLHFVPVIV